MTRQQVSAFERHLELFEVPGVLNAHADDGAREQVERPVLLDRRFERECHVAPHPRRLRSRNPCRRRSRTMSLIPPGWATWISMPPKWLTVVAAEAAGGLATDDRSRAGVPKRLS